MMLIESYRSLLVVSCAITASFGAAVQVPDDPPHRPDEVQSEERHLISVAKRATAIDNINVCFDCDGACQTLISGTTYKTPANYFAALVSQLNTIYSNSQLPLTATLKLLTTSSVDINLDPYGNFTKLQQPMDFYWASRIAARQASGCHVSFLITDDPVFSKSGMSAGLSYINSMCTEYGYAISRWNSLIAAEASRVAHEIAHSMNVNHISDGAISFTNDVMVQVRCYPDTCSDPTGSCITLGVLPSPPPSRFSLCGRAIFFAWRAAGYGNCIGPMVTYYDVGSG